MFEFRKLWFDNCYLHFSIDSEFYTISKNTAMAKYNLKINGKIRQVDVDPTTPMLWVLRDHLDMPGTKYGCGIAQCGACTVHLNGTAVSLLPAARIGGRQRGHHHHRRVYRLRATIPYRKPGWNTTWPSAATARRGRS